MSRGYCAALGRSQADLLLSCGVGMASSTPGAWASGHGLGASALVSAEGEGGRVKGTAPSRCEAGWPALVYGFKAGEQTHSFLRAGPALLRTR